MKTLFFHQILQVTLRISIEDSEVCEILKLTLGLYFEIFWVYIPIYNSKSSLPTTGTFRYLESQIEGLFNTLHTQYIVGMWWSLPPSYSLVSLFILHLLSCHDNLAVEWLLFWKKIAKNSQLLNKTIGASRWNSSRMADPMTISPYHVTCKSSVMKGLCTKCH